ncbi:unnamed protein product [Vicia faba]|uniref:Uncharacterized protein n=1 Tax=Vicia faba TaxID=3906 RepID=A0AAV0ZZL1_VICFA|nr:unnamed protein product [Vicia faba]
MTLWSPVTNWDSTPLRRGYFEFFIKIKGGSPIGSWNVKLSFLRLSAWTPNIRPENLKIAYVQLCLRRMKDDFVVAIQPENEINANEEHLSETYSLNEEEIIVETDNGLSENLVIEKGIIEDRREQSNTSIMVMENKSNNSVRDSCDGLYLEKNNNLWDIEDNPCKPQQEEFVVVKKNGRKRHKLTQPRMEIRTRAMSGKHNTTQ